jgi:hypothetical protein
MISTQASTKLKCLMTCLNEQDCSLVVFNKVSFQCEIYNLFPIVDQELLPDNNVIVFVIDFILQRT